MKKKILLVGEHPCGNSGNSHMINTLLQQINMDLYDITVFAATPASYPSIDLFKIVEGGNNYNDEFGASQLVAFLDRNTFDVVCFIGLDIWAYSRVYPQLLHLKQKNKFIWSCLVPYDAYTLRVDWLPLFQAVDVPCVYSNYAFDLLKDKVNNLRYFRPPIFDEKKFILYPDSKKKEIRKKLFNEHVNDETLVFGFFGRNQFRKDPLRVIKAFFEVKKEIPNSALYLHMDIADQRSIFNIDQYIRDCGGKLGDILVKKQGLAYPTEALVEAYNAVDCLVNASWQEGLSWTILEAMLCGTPVVASNNTAQIELLEGGAGIGVPSSEIAFLPVLSGSGASTFIESRACTFSSLVYAMKSMKDERARKNLQYRGMRKAKDWVNDTSDINALLRKACEFKPIIQWSPKKQIVLFAQHSAAGDVFMTTRCLKDIKERHGNMKLHYMTQKKYQDILVGNPYIDEIIDWDENQFKQYQIVYNPHGERILPGHWGRNSNSILSDFYWKILLIDKPDDFFITLKVPENPIADEVLDSKLPICILHTTGGDAEFRTYKYMGDVAEGLRGKYFTIQIGGKDDYSANADLDLRGKLSYRESAWVISKAKIAVTVDSFISHLCGAFGVSQVCLFGSGNAAVVKPNQVRGKLIEMSPDYIRICKGLGPCSASVRDCPIKCTGSHDPKEILENIKKLEQFRVKVHLEKDCGIHNKQFVIDTVIESINKGGALRKGGTI